jgi:hypothetical protein
MRYSIIAVVAALSAAVSATPMKKRGSRPYPSASGRAYPSKKAAATTTKPPFPNWSPNPSHMPMPITMAEECEICDYDHFYYSSECDDECRYEYDVYYYYEDCEECDKSLQPAYPTYECVVTEAAEATTAAIKQNTVTVTVEPTEGCEEFLKNNPTCVYCESESEAEATSCETTVTSLTMATSYVTSASEEEAEETCAAVTVTVTTTPCSTLATVAPCAGCDEEYVTEQGQTVTSYITSTSLCTTYCTETEAATCVYGAMTTTITYPTTVTYTATTSCAGTASYCELQGTQYPCPTTIYYETATYCTTGVYTFGGMESDCPTSACSVTYPTYCPSVTTYAWYSTVTSACESCPVATITAAECEITSCTTTYTATSTYCPTAGVYTCGTETVTVPAATWVYYVEPCPTNYVCSYDDWCSDSQHFVVYEYIGTYLAGTYECDMDSWVEPCPTSQYFPEPTICVINDIEINITVAPTWYTWNTYTTTTTTTTYPWHPHSSGAPRSGAPHPSGRPPVGAHGGPPSGAPGGPPSGAPRGPPSGGAPSGPPGAPPPGSPFSLFGSIGGIRFILIAENGFLGASSDLSIVGTIFEPMSNHQFKDEAGNVYGIEALGDIIEYTGFSGRFAKRDVDIIWTQGPNGPVATYLNQSLVYSACESGDETTINLDTGVVEGCSSFTPQMLAAGATLSSLGNSTLGNGLNGTAPAPAPSGPPSGPPSGINGTSPPPSPADPPSPAGPPSGPGNNTSPPTGAPVSAPAPASNNTNSTGNSTMQRRDFQRRFVY